MQISDKWRDYELLDCSGGERLERWGKYILIRPDPQVIWNTDRTRAEWRRADGVYHRSERGGGSWSGKLPESWEIGYGQLRFCVRPMGFKHTGLFPEQAVNWDRMGELIRGRRGTATVLNLFAYTGGATAACASAGASVCHVDASRGMTEQAKENLRLSGLGDAPVRYIVDDCRKFVMREIRRGHTYDGIIMDPPSYGRGPSGEVWHLEDSIHELIALSAQLLSDKPLFFLVNSYTTGLSPLSMEYILRVEIAARRGGHLDADEIALPVTGTGGALPCGASAWWLS